MDEVLRDIIEKLRHGDYQNEEHVRFSLVGRLLFELGWDVWNPTEVNTEFAAVPAEDRSRVDVALFAKSYSPSVYVEVKAVGKIGQNLSELERQVRDYNRNNTALFSTITDGRTWRFYYSQTGGEFHQKCFKECDFLQDNLEDLEQTFSMFLGKESILSGRAEDEARKYLQLSNKQRAVQDCLPQARRLVQAPPFPTLPKAIAKLVEQKGIVFSESEAAEFLERMPEPAAPVLTPKEPPPRVARAAMRNDSLSQIGYVLKGKHYSAKNGRNVLVEVMKLLSKSDPNFLSGFAARKDGKRRRYIAQAQNDLYPGRPDLSHLSEEIYPGWWVGTNYGKPGIKTILGLACEVAGITFGTDLVIDLGEKAKLPELKDYPPSNTVPGGQKKEPILPFKSTFYIKAVRGANAKAEINQEGVVIKQGSEIATSVTATMPYHAENQRQELIEREIVVPKGDKLVFSQDFLFPNPSIAAAIVMGRSAGGPREWKDEKGRTLKSYQEKDI